MFHISFVLASVSCNLNAFCRTCTEAHQSRGSRTEAETSLHSALVCPAVIISF